jgi:Fe-S-cluster containining protein
VSASDDLHGPEAFFRDMRQAFGRTLAQATASDAHRDNVNDALLGQAWDSFEGNLAIQCEDQPPVACQKGCPSCCMLRVEVLAPEAFRVAELIRASAERLRPHGIDLEAQVRAADAVTRGLGEEARVKQKHPCAFMARGACLIHPVRPLACRGHASHDRRACVDAAAGRRNSVPFSGPHRVVRLLVHSALQAALHDGGLAWHTAELNHAVVLALDNPLAPRQWLAGGDPLAPAAMDPAQHAAQAAWLNSLQPPPATG